MKQKKEIVEGNLAIAFFVGFIDEDMKALFGGKTILTFHKSFYHLIPPHRMNDLAWQYISPDELKFHSSWDWLMPVVEKIGKMNEPFIHKLPVSKLSIFTPIEEVFHKVVDFIKWYNQQSPKP